MIKKEVVCDRCHKEKPVYFIPKSDTFGKNAVLCERCATYYFNIGRPNNHCSKCNKKIEDYNNAYKVNGLYYCSKLCAIRSHFDDMEQPCLFTEAHEEMLLDEDS